MRLLGLAPVLCALVAPVSASAAPSTASSAGANDFAFATYGALKGKSGNLFLSPPSLRQALGVAYLGARGSTASEISAVLHLDTDRGRAAAQAKDEINGWQSARGASQLAIANRLWGDQRFSMADDFLQKSRDAYGSPVERVDFAHAPGPARVTINDWVAKQTNDKIKDLLPPPSVTADTRLVITNAIWFKGTWAVTFDKTATRDEPFSVDPRTKVSAPTMHQTSTFSYAAVPNAGLKVLEMPYGKSDLAMDILLPDSAGGLSKVEEQLSAGAFATWTSSLAQKKVVVSLPKFTFTWGGSVKPELSKLGMRTAFTESAADFTGIAPPQAAGGNLYISDVVHKAFVAVDEEGTEAAAATGVVFARELAAIEPPPERFTADHPFVFVIRDVKRGNVLFIGRVTNPKA